MLLQHDVQYIVFYLVNTVTMTPSQINITQVQQLPVVRVPERVTAQQANSGQTAILFPHQGTSHAHTTHGHAIPNMVWRKPVLFL